MIALGFLAGVVWGVTLWVRRRALRRRAGLTALDGQTRSMEGRGGF
jgi:hypothetical protein